MDIVYGKKNVMVSTKMGLGKSLIYQAMLLINSRAIVLTITSTITLMEDQKKELRQRSISVLAFIATAVKADSNILK